MLLNYSLYLLININCIIIILSVITYSYYLTMCIVLILFMLYCAPFLKIYLFVFHLNLYSDILFVITVYSEYIIYYYCIFEIYYFYYYTDIYIFYILINYIY